MHKVRFRLCNKLRLIEVLFSIGGLFWDILVAKFTGFVCRLAKDNLCKSVSVLFRSNSCDFESSCLQLVMELETEFLNLVFLDRSTLSFNYFESEFVMAQEKPSKNFTAVKNTVGSFFKKKLMRQYFITGKSLAENDFVVGFVTWFVLGVVTELIFNSFPKEWSHGGVGADRLGNLRFQLLGL